MPSIPHLPFLLLFDDEIDLKQQLRLALPLANKQRDKITKKVYQLYYQQFPKDVHHKVTAKTKQQRQQNNMSSSPTIELSQSECELISLWHLIDIRSYLCIFSICFLVFCERIIYVFLLCFVANLSFKLGGFS